MGRAVRTVAGSGVALAVAAALVTLTAPAGATVPGVVAGWGDAAGGALGEGSSGSSAVPVLADLPAGTTVVAVAAGGSHTLALTATGTVYAWGSNGNGQLGTGTTAASPRPTKVTGLADVTRVAAGEADSFAVTSTGALYAWGADAAGQLGIGTTARATRPTKVTLPGGERVTAVAAGYDHTLALGANGRVYSWGDDAAGELGRDGAVARPAAPTEKPAAVSLPGGARATAVAAGYLDSFAVASTGGVDAWGYGAYHELGDGRDTDVRTPVAVDLPAGVAVTAVAAGYAQTVALSSTGAVYTWGYDNAGQLGTGPGVAYAGTPAKVALPAAATAVAAGLADSYALTAAGAVEAWGADDLGQLGTGATAAASDVPVGVDLPAGSRAAAIGAGPGAQAAFAVVADPTTTTLAASGSPTTAGADVTFTAAVSGSGGRGDVRFAEGGATIAGCGSVAVTGAGTAGCTTATLPVGSDAVTASYSGYGIAAASSGRLTQVVRHPTALVAAPANASLSGLTLSATLTSGGSPVAGQSVSFAVDGSGSASCSAVTGASGVASCSVAAAAALFATGYTATYAGTTAYAPASATGSVSL